MEFKADTLDDALGAIMGRLLKSGNRILAGKGAALEFTSVLVTLTDPRARFSRTEDRSTLFSCLGETLWYLSGSDRLDHISYYIPPYRKFIGASPRARGGLRALMARASSAEGTGARSPRSSPP